VGVLPCRQIECLADVTMRLLQCDPLVVRDLLVLVAGVAGVGIRRGQLVPRTPLGSSKMASLRHSRARLPAWSSWRQQSRDSPCR
jgi:hypothetical protein